VSDTITVRETYERPTVEYPMGSYLFRVGSRFIKSTGRFEGLADCFPPEDVAWMRMATLYRSMFMMDTQPQIGFILSTILPWDVDPCVALVKEGPKAMVMHGK
jgi:hypothetical protein